MAKLALWGRPTGHFQSQFLCTELSLIHAVLVLVLTERSPTPTLGTFRVMYCWKEKRPTNRLFKNRNLLKRICF